MIFNSARKIKYTDLESELSFILLFKKFPKSTATIPLLTDLEQQSWIISVTKTFPFTENPKSLMATVVQDGVKAYPSLAQCMATCQNYVIGG